MAKKALTPAEKEEERKKRLFLIIKLGFILASAITFTVVLFYCGERKPFIYIFTIALAVGIYFLFSKVFHVSLPAGVLPF